MAGGFMGREHHPDLAKAINRLNRAMADLATINSAIGFGLGRALECGLRNIETLAPREPSNQNLDRVFDYFATRPRNANREGWPDRAAHASFPRR
ncbi:MAG: hypothetical protein B7Z29_07225 [Hyphomicrobium sp. 12-62-95]|nr:MAG: hypothetical protein B7Z29_07225 [Hyphomicrobium sp. 12-62-95]